MSRVLRLPLAFVLVWILAGELLLPHLVSWLYRNGELSARIPELQEARQAHPLAYYLREWRELVVWVAGAGGLYLLLAWWTTREGFRRRNLTGATPASLGGIRFLAGLTAAAVLAWEDVASLAMLSPEMARGRGVVDLLLRLPVGDEWLLSTPWALALLDSAGVVLLLLAAVGWRTRWTLPSGTAVYLLAGGLVRQYFRLFHVGLVPLYVLLVLCFSPCADGWSLDRRRRARRGEPVPPEEPAPVYGWARFACWLVIALPYVEAGLMKLRRGGWRWWDATHLRDVVYADNLSPMEFDWGLWRHLLPAPDGLFAGLGLAALALELGYGLVLVSPLARRLLPVATAAFHVGTLLLQNVFFPDLVLLQLVFYDWRPLARRLGLGAERAAARAGTPESPLAAGWPRAVRWIAGVFLFVWAFRVEIYPLSAMQMYSSRRADGEVRYEQLLGRRRSGGLEVLRPEERIGVLSDGRYRWLLAGVFEPGNSRQEEAFFRSLAAAYRGGDDPLVGFEVQRWLWRFVKEPLHPERAELVTTRRIELPRTHEPQPPAPPPVPDPR